MAEFLGDIAFMIEILVLGVGLVVLYFGRKENSKLVKASGWIMSVAATLGLICTGYFYFKYYFAGSFERAYPQHHMMKKSMIKGGMGVMGGKNIKKSMNHCMRKMQGKKMDSDMMDKMKSCMMQDVDNLESGKKERTKEEHDSHH